MSGNTQKLAVLRARTDHDILVLVQQELNRGMALVEAAATGGCALIAQADKAYARAMALLPKISGLSQEDRKALETKLNDLRARLDQVSASARMQWSASVA